MSNSPLGQEPGSGNDSGEGEDAGGRIVRGLEAPPGFPVYPEVEDSEEWRSHRDAIVEDLEPSGIVETTYADHIALLMWRMARFSEYEAFAISARLQRLGDEFEAIAAKPKMARSQSDLLDALEYKRLRDLHRKARDWARASRGNPEAEEDERKALAAAEAFLQAARRVRSLPDAKTMDALIKYENHLQKAFDRATQDLDKLKDQRLKRATAAVPSHKRGSRGKRTSDQD